MPPFVSSNTDCIWSLILLSMGPYGAHHASVNMLVYPYNGTQYLVVTFMGPYGAHHESSELENLFDPSQLSGDYSD